MLPVLLCAALAFAQDPAPATSAAPATPAPPAEPVPVIQQDATAPAPVVTEEAPPTAILFPVRVVNIGAMEARAAEILFRRRYEAATGQHAFPEDSVRSAVTVADDIGLYAACQALGCKTWITIDLVRLDKEIFVTITERDAAAVVTQRIESVASGLDTLPALFDRAARALAAHVPIERVPAAVSRSSESGAPTGVRDTSAVTQRGAKPGVNSLSGFKLGVLGPFWPNFGASLTHTFTWRRETEDRFFELDAGVTFPLGISDARTFAMVFLEVGLSHIFPSKGSTAFYAGGGFGPRAGGYDNFGVGVGIYGQGGILFGRNAAVQPYLQLKVGGDAFTASLAQPYIISYGGLEAGVGF
jgi:hypothetical protein